MANQTMADFDDNTSQQEVQAMASDHCYIFGQKRKGKSLKIDPN